MRRQLAAIYCATTDEGKPRLRIEVLNHGMVWLVVDDIDGCAWEYASGSCKALNHLRELEKKHGVPAW